MGPPGVCWQLVLPIGRKPWLPGARAPLEKLTGPPAAGAGAPCGDVLYAAGLAAVLGGARRGRVVYAGAQGVALCCPTRRREEAAPPDVSRSGSPGPGRPQCNPHRGHV
ncbi:hypothetical protein NDU88_003235 [Pleurodeles waltl]|uniref:Uncharacterized protein n=1 Tax=Pleurodeles waltl TaxID=8319 RepID=A0AAV7Q8E9_PLEWA|nr:hypothetical protein NDU88_003235 [Pleurodeles waltl]